MRLIVTADGTVECRLFPHGCEALFIIEPGTWSPGGWTPDADTPSFGVHPDPWELNGESPTGAPATIAPGDYTFAIAVAEHNDIIGGDPYLEVSVPCKIEMKVPVTAESVTVEATFGEACRIEVGIG